MNENELEKKLAKINLAAPSDSYLENGLESLQMAETSGSFLHRHLQFMLASALVISVSINLLQLAGSRLGDASESELVTQCETPPAAMSPSQEMDFHLVADEKTLMPVGMC